MLRAALIAVLFGAATAAQAADLTAYQVAPSEADPVVSQFNDPNIVLFDPAATPQLAVFLPGTGGKPANAKLLLNIIAGQGYRVIGLEYDDDPAVVQVCPRNPDSDCSAKFRQARSFGDVTGGPVDNPRAESIEARLTALLKYLDRKHPEQKWGSYLADGHPAWDRIVLSGLSQGAGMAAYIAKKYSVARVVLFSSPWDFIAPSRAPAPWLSLPSATPPDRWYGEFHARENTAPLIQQAYGVLKIPADHISTFNLDLPEHAGGPNPFHGSTIRLEGYVPQWQAMYGRSP